MASNGRQWITYPKFLVTLPEDGKVTGTVEFAVTRGTHISITSVGRHINDQVPGVMFRETEYKIHVHAHLINGAWTADNYTTVEKRHSWNVSAPKTHFAAIVDAVLASIPQAATPMVLATAEYADAWNDESREVEDVAELEMKLKAARTKLKAATRRRVNANDAKTAALVDSIDKEI